MDSGKGRLRSWFMIHFDEISIYFWVIKIEWSTTVLLGLENQLKLLNLNKALTKEGLKDVKRWSSWKISRISFKILNGKSKYFSKCYLLLSLFNYLLNKWFNSLEETKTEVDLFFTSNNLSARLKFYYLFDYNSIIFNDIFIKFFRRDESSSQRIWLKSKVILRLSHDITTILRDYHN